VTFCGFRGKNGTSFFALSPLPPTTLSMTPLPPICLITTGDDTALEVVEALLDAGARWFQLRAKGIADRDLFHRGERLAARLHAAGGLLTINDRADVAAALGAGLHLGQNDLPLTEARRLLPNAVIGISVHDQAEAAAATAAGGDYVGCGALFPTTTKADTHPLSAATLQEIVAAFPGPVVGIGGVTPDNAATLATAGLAGVAVAAAVFQAADPVAAYHRLVAVLQEG